MSPAPAASTSTFHAFWIAFGLGAQVLFSARFLVQWIASERRRESTVPPAFWYLSMAGGLMLLAYAIWRRDPVFIAGQSAGIVVYARNIVLLRRAARRGRDGGEGGGGAGGVGAGGGEPRRRASVPTSPWLALAALALLLAFAFQGTRGLWEPDEGRYAEVAREMLTTGDFITPHLDAQPHFTKPPLTYWCIAASIAAFGRSEWAVRLYLSLAFVATVLVAAALGGRLWDRTTGLWAGAVYATSLTPFAGATFVTPDTLLALWETIALYAFWRGFTAERRGGRWAWPALAGTALGLAFLTKGPAGLVFLPAMLLFRLLPAGRRAGAAPVLNLTGIVLLLAIGLSWFAKVAAQRSGLAGYFLGEEVLGRLAGHHHRNPQWYGPVAIYGLALVAGALPWCLFWPRLGRWLRAAAGAGGFRRALLDRPRALFPFLSFLLPLVIFSLSRSRLPLYVLPLFVPLALVTARALTGMNAPAKRLAPAVAAWAIVLAGVRLGLALWPTDRDARLLFRSLPPVGEAEVVIEDGRTHHGLAFYSERDLEYVSWSRRSLDSIACVPIADEIAEEGRRGNHPHLYLVEEKEAEHLEALLKQAGASIRERRKVGGLEVLLTAPPPS